MKRKSRQPGRSTISTAISPRQANVVELRYFGGLTEADIGRVLRVARDWRVARLFLSRILAPAALDRTEVAAREQR